MYGRLANENNIVIDVTDTHKYGVNANSSRNNTEHTILIQILLKKCITRSPKTRSGLEEWLGKTIDLIS